MPISGLHVSLFLYALVVLALLVAELREDRRAQKLFKPLTALGFVLLALSSGALETPYGWVVLAGLIVCALGDILLLSKGTGKLFEAGMAAFALGHILYGVAFWTAFEGQSLNYFLIATIVSLISGATFLYWIVPKLNGRLRRDVIIYSLIIITMVIMSMRLDPIGALVYAPIAAVIFAISDMFVARDRFVKPDPKNFLAITPLYFGAQALFALSTSI